MKFFHLLFAVAAFVVSGRNKYTTTLYKYVSCEAINNYTAASVKQKSCSFGLDINEEQKFGYFFVH